VREIETARNIHRINEAAQNGLTPLLKKVVPSSAIRQKYCIRQHRKTGEIKVIGDFREVHELDRNNDFVTVIDWTYYYPYTFESPFAAYLIPKDIVIGERVFIEDLIEDYIGESWNQGDNYRLESCVAIWNGTDLEIQYNPDTDNLRSIG
jgi:hypothetical protein